MRWWRVLGVSAGVMCLAGCGSMKTASPFPAPMLAANDYVAMADHALGAEKQSWLLQAADRYLQDRQPVQAHRILTQVEAAALPIAEQAQYRLLQAQYRFLTKQYRESLSRLAQIDVQDPTLPSEQRQRVYELRAQNYLALGQVMNSVETRGQLGALLAEGSEAAFANAKQCWLALAALSPTQLTEAQAQHNSEFDQGWLQLVDLIGDRDGAVLSLTEELSRWQTQYPHHMANVLLPQREVGERPAVHKVALLLPVSGPLAKSGLAVRNGIFASFYHWRDKAINPPSIAVYDTAQGDVNQLYQQAIAEHADFVVGPLAKPHVAALVAHASFTVPTVVLNDSGDMALDANNLYSLSLSPLDEARQVADKAAHDHHQHALVIAPKTAWGDNVVAAFTQRWGALGGDVVTDFRYRSTKGLGANLRQTLGLRYSEARARELMRRLGKKLRYIPRRRKDFDMVFLVANRSMASQVQPLLKFYYTGSVPIYATSLLYQGVANTNRDADLNGIMFCDMPWVLTPGQLHPDYLNQLQASVSQLWSKTYRSSPKLFALGVDAFDLVYKLDKMRALPSFGSHAATGTLYLTANHHVFRELPWAQFKRGRARVLS